MYLTHLYIVHFWEIHICITNKVLGVMNRIKTKYFEKKKWWYFFESISYLLYISLSSSPVRSLNILPSGWTNFFINECLSAGWSWMFGSYWGRSKKEKKSKKPKFFYENSKKRFQTFLNLLSTYFNFTFSDRPSNFDRSAPT